jgi:hypothetical protein
VSESETYSAADWAGYLDESLPDARMQQLEAALRHDPALIAQLQQLISRRDQGQHSLATIWRRAQLTCATRTEWGHYLLGILEPAQAAYMQFHLENVGCRFCQANVQDLESQQTAATLAVQRRKKYFASSAGYLQRQG